MGAICLIETLGMVARGPTLGARIDAHNGASAAVNYAVSGQVESVGVSGVHAYPYCRHHAKPGQLEPLSNCRCFRGVTQDPLTPLSRWVSKHPVTAARVAPHPSNTPHFKALSPISRHDTYTMGLPIPMTQQSQSLTKPCQSARPARSRS